MRKALRRILPSQFERRLLLLAMAVLGGLAVLGGRLLVLGGWQREQALASAEAALVQVEYLPTMRGRILDRHGRVLAENSGCFDVAVRYSVIANTWPYEQARRQAMRENAGVWGELDYTAREALIEKYVPAYQQQVDQLWQILASVGEIDLAELERRRQTQISRVSQMANYVWEVRRRQRLLQAEGPVDLADVANPLAEHKALHPLLTRLTAEQRVVVERLLAEAAGAARATGSEVRQLSVWKEVALQRGVDRQYPCRTMRVMVDRSTWPTPLRSEAPVEREVRGVALQIIGALRDVQQEEMARRPFWPAGAKEPDLHGYRPGDLCGQWGLERGMEEELRGWRGKATYRLDTGQQEIQAAQPGKDVRSSIDVHLQARVQAMLDPELGLMRGQAWHFKGAEQGRWYGRPLRGAVVVLEVATGQVLAAVSQPAMTQEDLEQRPKWVWGDKVDWPYINRAYGRAYPPGSTIKPLVLAAAVTEDEFGPGQTVNCQGVFDPKHPNIWRCWIYKASNFTQTHGPLTGPEGIAQSCNVFFHTMGRRLGPKRLVTWYDRFGVGRLTALGLSELEQANGSLPDLRRADEPRAAGFSYSDAVFMAIGQGRVNWSPLQAASAYATIARGGLLIQPTFVVGGESAPSVDLHLDPRGVEMVLEGLRKSVEDRTGTTNHLTHLGNEPIFNITGVKVMAKSGTADPGRVWLDLDGDGQRSRQEIAYYGDHSWTVALVQRPGSKRPDYAVAVLVEFGGSGGGCAAPIANQVLHALRAEGYL